MSKEKIKRVVIIAGYKCNCYCLFCLNSHKRDIPDKTTQEIKEEMIRARRKGVKYLELNGGELTIRPDIIDLVKFARNLNFSVITIPTNGLMFSYKTFTKKIIEAGLNNIIFSIHGHNAKLHDYLTQVPGSFKKLEQGLKNVKNCIKKLGLKNIYLGSDTVIVKQNYRHLPQIGKYIFDLGFRDSEFIFVDPSQGEAYENFEKLVPKISNIAPYVNKCLDIGKKHNIPHWHIRYVPLCYFRDYLDQISELEELKIFRTEHIAPDFTNLNVEKSRISLAKSKTEKCRNCKLYDKCEGIWKEYLKHYGDKELKAIK